jgi:hypothetical protein
VVLSLRRLLAVAAILLLGLAVALILRSQPWAWISAAVLSVLASIFLLLWPAAHSPIVESDQVEQLARERRQELIRGTSLQLRQMKYRYSVRPDSGARAAFSARVNQIQLGFLPVVITDNQTDRQGLGFVAFVHDGRRWRGPGLPCAGTREDALEHAAKCVEPLAGMEDTHA